MKKLFVGLLVLISTKSFASEVIVNTRYKGSVQNKMCQQAINILNRLKNIDYSINLELECSEREVNEERSLFGMKNTVTSYEVVGSYAGDVARRCTKAESFHIVTVPVLASHYRSKDGMPAGINPYLKDMLDRLNIEYSFSIRSFKYDGMAPFDFVIQYPDCK